MLQVMIAHGPQQLQLRLVRVVIGDGLCERFGYRRATTAQSQGRAT
jgi:hypothetical protein